MICVSVPYWKTPWVVRRAVELILAQTWRDLVLVVTNDGDHPKVWDWLDGVNDSRLVRFDLAKNRGRYYADSVVLAANPHPYFTVHDSDDWSQVDRLEVLMGRLGAADAVVDGFTRHGTNGQTERHKPQPQLIGHQSPRSLWHFAHHKGIWQTDALRPLGMGPQFRMGWDTYLMHYAALTLKVEWVQYFGYNQQRRPGSLISSPDSGPQSKQRANAVIVMNQQWKEAQASPERIPEILAPPPDLAARIEQDAARLRGLL